MNRFARTSEAKNLGAAALDAKHEGGRAAPGSHPVGVLPARGRLGSAEDPQPLPEQPAERPRGHAIDEQVRRRRDRDQQPTHGLHHLQVDFCQKEGFTWKSSSASKNIFVTHLSFPELSTNSGGCDCTSISLKFGGSQYRGILFK